MKVAFVCFFAAAPPTGGAGTVTCALAESLGGERLLVQPGPAERQFSTPGGVPVWQLRLDGDRGWRKLLRIPHYIWQVTRVVERTGTAVVILEGASWVLYHWWLLERLRRLRPAPRVIYHAHNVEYELRAQRHGWITRSITRWAEGRVLHRADCTLAASERDQTQFRLLYGVQPEVLPNGVVSRRYSGVSAAATAACRTTYDLGPDLILFMGSYAYPPNREAIDFLVTAVMPRVLADYPSARLAVIGGAIPYQRSWLRTPGLLPDGELPAFVRCCAVSAAPVFSGSGTRLKILESLAAGVPVVASRKGAEGLALQPEVEIELAETPGDFASALLALLRDPERRRRLGAAGQERVASHYDWTRLVPVLERALATRTPAPEQT